MGNGISSFNPTQNTSNVDEKISNIELKYNILVIGDRGVGKTSLLSKYFDDQFDDSYESTMSIDLKTQKIRMDDNRLCQLHIWDYSGALLEVRFKTVTIHYYRGAHGIIIVYDVNERNTFTNVERWMKDIKEFSKETVAIILVGNKIDLINRQVTFDEGKQLALSHNIPFIEVSAKNRTNLDEPFLSIIKNLPNLN